MNPRQYLRTLVEVENAAADRGYSVLEARAALATLLMAQEYGWPSAQETLTDRQWWRLLDILDRAGLSVPGDFTGPVADPAQVDGSFLGPYGRPSVAGSLLALPGCAFVVRQYLHPLLTPRTRGTVRRVEFDGSRWQVICATRGRADQRVPLGMFVSCTVPDPSVTSDPSDRVVPVIHSPQPGAGHLQGPQSAGAVGGCGSTGASPLAASPAP